jgi:hypothetical protein
MAAVVNELKYDRSRVQEPNFVSNMSIRQREIDPITGQIKTVRGNGFTIERLMPVPYKLTMRLDIWTSNTEQKLQILEQILALYNPALEIQNTDNYVDWSSLSYVELIDTTWSSRSVPTGTENPIDIATLRFNVPIWISSPAKVKKLGVIERVVASIYDAQGDAINAITNSDLLLGTRQIITPYNYKIVLIGNQVQVLQERTIVDQTNQSLVAPSIVSSSNVMWPSIIGMYGTLRPGISQLRLDQDDGTQVIGTIVVDPNDQRFLLFSVDEDTVPQNTLAPVDAVINPLVSGPGQGLPNPAAGQRYLLTESTGAEGNVGPATAWVGPNGRPLVAEYNDIIQFNGARWDVAFMARTQGGDQYVTNLTTSLQYQWTGAEWTKSYQGIYPGGQWNLVL